MVKEPFVVAILSSLATAAEEEEGFVGPSKRTNKAKKFIVAVEIDEIEESRNAAEKKAAYAACKEFFGKKRFKIIQLFDGTKSKEQQFGSTYKAWCPDNENLVPHRVVVRY